MSIPVYAPVSYEQVTRREVYEKRVVKFRAGYILPTPKASLDSKTHVILHGTLKAGARG